MSASGCGQDRAEVYPQCSVMLTKYDPLCPFCPVLLPLLFFLSLLSTQYLSFRSHQCHDSKCLNASLNSSLLSTDIIRHFTGILSCSSPAASAQVSVLWLVLMVTDVLLVGADGSTLPLEVGLQEMPVGAQRLLFPFLKM